MSNKIVLAGNKNLLKPIITELLAFHQLLEQKDVGTIYAYTNDLNSVRRIEKPKVTLFFLEDSNFSKTAPPNKIPEGRRRQEGVIRFRIMNETTQSFSKSNGTTLGNRIKEIFGSNGGFIWQKGKTMYSYSDWERGYQFQLLCKTKTEAKRIITAVHSLQNHRADWKYFNTVENDEEFNKYPENPGTHVVMGETISLPHERPIVDVRFQYAYVRLDGVIDPITLYDRRNKRAGALVS
jgi:hypothetical protein